MTLQVVGTGLGRTGTMSMKLALEQLGFGPCHHMVEVFAHMDSVPLWVAAAEGKPDWEAVFEGYSSVVDYPGAAFWRELVAHYPKAKVLHTVRDPNDWFESTQATIFAPRTGEAMPPPMQAFFGAVMRELGDKRNDRAFMVDYFERHTAEVLRTIPNDRLLVYRAGDGWAPLCAFLGVPVPDTQFPKVNDRAEFQARASAGQPAAEPEPA
jgi:Sulfotransferase domain